MPPTADYDSDTSSLLTLSDSLCRTLYRYEGERRIQAVNEDYAWPCDGTATTLEHLTAEILELTYENGLYPEPYEGAMDEVLSGEQPRVLDLGSGATASWCVSMAQRFPEVECIGVDLIPTELEYLPPNLAIEIYDLLEGLPYPDDYFSLIHCRFCSASFLENPSFDFLSEIARTLRPGGVLMLQEQDVSPVTSLQTPFLSRLPFHPQLDRLNAHHLTRISGFVARQPKFRASLDWATRMAGWVRATPGFSSSSGGGEERVYEMVIEHPLGGVNRLGASVVPSQAERGGMLVREWWLAVWELCYVAAGLTEVEIAKAREVDEELLPKEDVGIYCQCRVVWAVKSS